jgi:hypothetical protein
MLNAETPQRVSRCSRHSRLLAHRPWRSGAFQQPQGGLRLACARCVASRAQRELKARLMLRSTQTSSVRPASIWARPCVLLGGATRLNARQGHGRSLSTLERPNIAVCIGPLTRTCREERQRVPGGTVCRAIYPPCSRGGHQPCLVPATFDRRGHNIDSVYSGLYGGVDLVEEDAASSVSSDGSVRSGSRDFIDASSTSPPGVAEPGVSLGTDAEGPTHE